MSPAKPADLQIRNSTRERTDCTSLPATPAALDEVLLLSRPVSLPRLERDVDSKVREIGWTVALGRYRSFQARWWMHIEHCRRQLIFESCEIMCCRCCKRITSTYIEELCKNLNDPVSSWEFSQ
jgi:hypothetical protein